MRIHEYIDRIQLFDFEIKLYNYNHQYPKRNTSQNVRFCKQISSYLLIPANHQFRFAITEKSILIDFVNEYSYIAEYPMALYLRFRNQYSQFHLLIEI